MYVAIILEIKVKARLLLWKNFHWVFLVLFHFRNKCFTIGLQSCLTGNITKKNSKHKCHFKFYENIYQMAVALGFPANDFSFV